MPKIKDNQTKQTRFNLQIKTWGEKILKLTLNNKRV